jgi:AAHS family 4-hydroxybenzoate transporter-like MFS transporter
MRGDPPVKATGVGWALGVGRIGSIVGPLIGGVLLQQKWSAAAVFMAAAGAAFCAAAAAFSLSRLIGGNKGKVAVDRPTSFDAKLNPAAKAGT